MSFSIFHSRATWSSPNSKEMARTDVEDEATLHAEAQRLLRSGHKINGVIPDYQDECEQAQRRQNETAPRARRHGH